MVDTGIGFIFIVVSTLLSYLGSTMTVLTYLRFPDLRSPSLTFALWLAVGSTGYGTLTFAKFLYNYDIVCKLAATLNTYFNLVSVFTSVIVAKCMHIVFFSDKLVGQNATKVKVERWHYVFVFVTPVVLAILPWSTDSYGKNHVDVFCWIYTEGDNEVAGYIWQCLVFYVPLLLSLLYIVICYYQVFSKYFDLTRRKNSAAPKILEAIDRIKWYPIILGGLYTIAIIHRFMAFAGHGLLIMSVLSGVSVKLQGFADAVAYGFTPSVIRRWRGIKAPLLSSDQGSSEAGITMSSSYDTHGTSHSSAVDSVVRDAEEHFTISGWKTNAPDPRLSVDI